ncbi:MAG: glycosyltransferase family 39 protein [Pseudomonadota bacterium]
MSSSPHRRPIEPGAWRWAGLLAALLLAAALGAWLLPPDGVLAGCERDGHFQRMGQVACGLVPANAPYGPLLPWMGAALTPLAGTPYLAGRLLGLLSLLGMVVVTWRAALRFGAGAGAAALAAALVALNPHLLLYGTMACTDMPASFLWLLALYFAAGVVDAPAGVWRPGVAGACGALAVLVRVQWLPPVVVLGGLLVLLLPAGGRRRLGWVCLFLTAVLLPLGIAIALGRRHYPDLQGVIGEYLGGLAFSRAAPRLGALATGDAPVAGAPGLAARLGWGAWLAVRVSGGLPLLGLGGALWVGLRHRLFPWRAALLVALASGACWAATAWSHPPPDLGAGRFFLALVAPGVVVGVLLGAGALRRRARWAAAGLLLAGAGGFLVAELSALRGIASRPAWPGGPALPRPEDRASDTDRAALAAGRALLAAEDVGCTPVYTNYHNAAALFRDARFLGAGSDAAHLDTLPGPVPAGRAWLLWVAPPGAAGLVAPRVAGLGAQAQAVGEGVSVWLLAPEASGGGR